MPTTEPSSRLGGFQRLAAATLAASLALIALGGAVRATDSGLACPDWPRCYGMWIPPADVHIWLEHSHRLLAGVVGLMIAALLLWALVRHRRRQVLVPAVAAAVLVNVQAALGALVVLRYLQAELVTAHLGMAFLVVGCLALLVIEVRRGTVPRAEQPAADLGYARAVAVITGLAFVQALVGAHVTGINAGLAFTDFPLYGGALVPEITGEREAFHVAHRLLAYLLAGGVVYLSSRAVRLRRDARRSGTWTAADRWLVTLPMWAATLVAVQIVLGVANLWTRASYLTVIPHLAVASWIWTILVFLVLLAYRRAGRPRPVVAPASREEVVR